MADLGFDCAAAAEVCHQIWRKAAPCAADKDARFCFTLAAVDDGQIGALVGQDGDLFQRFFQGVAVVRVARKAENLISPIALNRTNALFAGRDEGGIASLVQT